MPFFSHGAVRLPIEPDLGHLAWVLEDVRKSLNFASNAVRRFEWELNKRMDFSERNHTEMQAAYRQISQCAAVLEMVGHLQAAKLLRGLAMWCQRVVQQAETFTEDAASVAENACRALLDYFEGLLKGSESSPVALFAQYRAICQLTRADRIHPADLWPGVEGWQNFEPIRRMPVAPMGSVSRGNLEEALLPVLRDFNVSQAREMVDLCGRLAHLADTLLAKNFWWIAAGFFEALSLCELPNDVYVRRTAARIIPAFGMLEAGQSQALTDLVHELLFFCAFARHSPVPDQESTVLGELRNVFGLDREPAIDYQSAPFGNFDPSKLAQLRKSIGVAAQAWSAFSGGDLARAPGVVAQFAEVSAAVLQLHPYNRELMSALTAVVEITTRRAKAPGAAIAMEVATAILYLEIAYDDLELASHTMEQRSARIAARLNQVTERGEPMPIETWMEALYRRVGERKAMSTVVGELAIAVAEIEKSLDAFVRNPAELLLLEAVPVALGQMRGVFSVLGLDQAALAAVRMRSTTEQLIRPGEGTLEDTKNWTLQLVNSLSAFGFLIDMLRYQPVMAKEMFEYDEALGEFRFTMAREPGREQALRVHQVQAFTLTRPSPPIPSLAADPIEPEPQIIESPESLGRALDRIPFESGHEEAVAIKGIFLEEAREMVTAGRALTVELGVAPANPSGLGSLRRVFHTLKGGARMIGWDDLGDAAWAFEQLLNSWTEHDRPASDVMLTLCEAALNGMTAWIGSLSKEEPSPFQPADFRLCADALRLENRYLPLLLPGSCEQQAFEWHEESGIVAQPKELDGSPNTEQTDPPEQISGAQAAFSEANSLYQGANPGTGHVPHAAAQFVTVGALQLGRGLFDVFLNEAAVWAQQLQTALEKWEMQSSPDSAQKAAGLAHALQGSASAVGFKALAVLAQAMEGSIEYLELHFSSPSLATAVLLDGANEVHRLLDSFSRGVLDEPRATLLEALASLPPLLESAAPGAPAAVLAEEPVGPASPESDAEEVLKAPSSAKGIESAETGEPAVISASSRQIWELESVDMLDADLWPVFAEEGAELIKELSSSLRLWLRQPQEQQVRAQVLRTLHTLKGSARLAGALRLGELAHQMESALEAMPANTQYDAAGIASLLKYLDQIEFDFEDLTDPSNTGDVTDQNQLARAPASALGTSQSLPQPPALAKGLQSTVAASYVRVRTPVLDRLIDQAGEVMSGRARIERRLGQFSNAVADLGRDLERMRHQLRDLGLQTDLQMRSRQMQSPETTPLFDPLELDRFTALQELWRMLAESLADVDAVHKGLKADLVSAQEDVLGQGRRAKELTHGLLRMRLVEFESVADRLYSVVRQAAKETGKQVRLDMEGGSIEIDRGVLDRMTPSFEHLLRNAVVHGIEPSVMRVAAGKPATGAITISVHQNGSDVFVRVTDDGAGLKIEEIRSRAIAAKLLTPDQVLAYDEAAKLLFIPGFSTANQVTELAGRGIGMDVVLSDISALGGRIETSSPAGGGTCFEVVFPLTTAITQIVLLRMNTVTIGVPANLLETVLLITQDRMEDAYASGVFRQQTGPDIPFFSVGAILGASTYAQIARPGARQRSVAVVKSAGQHLALHVDEVLGNREVVVKNLGMQLSRLPGLVGISVLASGVVVLIYNPVALMNVFGDTARRADVSAFAGLARDVSAPNAQSKSEESSEATSPLVLVVDDSITVRRVTQRVLSRAGFRVALASDGVQALELLRDERPALVLSDLEMPRMDGMELTRQIRADAKLSDLPIIIITSRTAQKHRDHAAALGANHYLGKPYAEAELLGLVRSHCAVAEFA